VLSIEIRTSFIWGLIHCFLALGFFMGCATNMDSRSKRESLFQAVEAKKRREHFYKG